MSGKRKRIFKEALFIVPFMLLVTVVTLSLMFTVGRNVHDMVSLVKQNFNSDKAMDMSIYSEYDSKKYTLEYYKGEDEKCKKYASYSLNKKGDEPTESLILYEARDGFEPGYYKIEWFHLVEFVTYAPLEDEKNSTSYTAEDQPYMYDYVKSYSWESLMLGQGADFEMSRGYKLLKFISVYTWDSTERENIIIGLGGNPIAYYSYVNGKESEYQKVMLSWFGG